MTPETKMTYDLLSAPVEPTHFREAPGGGPQLEYITGEQCTTVLNEVLGYDGWTFRVVEHGIHEQSDEVWVLGELVVHTLERNIVRQQFGSEKIKRAKATGIPLEIGFQLKGAATDAMKKCASLIGVGLWLSHKDAKGGPPRNAPQRAPAVQPARVAPSAIPHRPAAPAPAFIDPDAVLKPSPLGGREFDCADCGKSYGTVKAGDALLPAAEWLAKLPKYGITVPVCADCAKQRQAAIKAARLPIEAGG